MASGFYLAAGEIGECAGEGGIGRGGELKMGLVEDGTLGQLSMGKIESNKRNIR